MEKQDMAITIIIASLVIMSCIIFYLSYKLNQETNECNGHWVNQLENYGFEIKNGMIKSIQKNNISRELNNLDYQKINQASK